MADYLSLKEAIYKDIFYNGINGGLFSRELKIVTSYNQKHETDYKPLYTRLDVGDLCLRHKPGSKKKLWEYDLHTFTLADSKAYNDNPDDYIKLMQVVV